MARTSSGVTYARWRRKAWARAAKAMALVRGRGYVIPEDVKEVAADVLRHRLIPTYEAEAEEITSDDLVARLLDRIPVP